MATNTAIYARVSTEDQLEGYSIDAQLTACREYALAHSLNVIEEYIDAGVSARYDDICRRPQFSRLINDAEAHKFAVLVVHKLDRFARNRRLAFEVLDRLEKCKVRFVSVTENIDFSTPWGSAVQGIFLVWADFFSRNLGAEIRKGKAGRKAAGLHNGHLPFGAMAGPDGVAIPNPATYPGLLLAYRLAADGASDSQVAQALNAGGYRIAKGRTLHLFSANSVCQLLPNRFYLGELPDGAGGWIPGKHSALVDGEIFERALSHRRQRAANRAPYSSPRTLFSLTGLVQCGHCGSRMWIYKASGKHRDYLDRARCSGRIGAQLCQQPVVSLWVIEDAVQQWLGGLVVHPEAVERVLSRQPANPDTGESERRRIEAALSRLRQQHMWGDITDAEYRAEAAGLRQQLAAIPAPVVAGDLRALAAGLRDAAAVWAGATQVERHQIAVRVIERVVVTGRDVRIVPRPEVAPLLT